jgi:hypothetical protein
LFGASLAGVGDTDGDGHGDFVVGAPGEGPPGQGGAPGAIELFSGRDGRALARETADPSRPENLGWSMAAVGDVDEDGTCDVLVGSLHRYAEVFSGKGLRRIHRAESRGGIRIMDAFASSLDRVGDVNGDGVVDWIIGANETVAGMFDEGYAQVYSGKYGELLRIDFHSDKLGVDVCGIGDVNGDGVPDEAIACPSQSWVRLLSGKVGKLLHEIDVAKLRESTPKKR